MHVACWSFPLKQTCWQPCPEEQGFVAVMKRWSNHQARNCAVTWRSISLLFYVLNLKSDFKSFTSVISIWLFLLIQINSIIIHQTHYEKSDWSRAFNQFTIACELDRHDKCNIYCSSQCAWLLSSLECFSSETKWLNASLLFLRMNYVKNV